MSRSNPAVQVQQKLPAGAKAPAKSPLTSESERLKILVDVLASEASDDERHEYFAQLARRMSAVSLRRVVKSLTHLCEESTSPKLQPAQKEVQKLREIFERELNHPKTPAPKKEEKRTPPETRGGSMKPMEKTSASPKVVSLSSVTTVRPRPTPIPTPAPAPLTGKEEVALARKKMKAFGPAGRPAGYSATPKDDCDLTTMVLPADGKVAKPPWPGTFTTSQELETPGKSGTRRHIGTQY